MRKVDATTSNGVQIAEEEKNTGDFNWSSFTGNKESCNPVAIYNHCLEKRQGTSLRTAGGCDGEDRIHKCLIFNIEVGIGPRPCVNTVAGTVRVQYRQPLGDNHRS